MLLSCSAAGKRDPLLLSNHSLQLPVPVQLADDLRILPPVLQHFYVELQEDLCPQDDFQFLARRRADFLEGAATAADQDSLLSFAVDVDRRSNADYLFGFLERIADDSDGVGDFLPGCFHRLFADNFRSQEAFRLVRVLVDGKLRSARGEILNKFLERAIDSIALQRGNWNNFVELSYFCQRFNQGEQLGFGDAIDFIEQKKTRSFKPLYAFDGAAVTLAEFFAGVEQQGHNINRVDGGVHFAHH